MKKSLITIVLSLILGTSFISCEKANLIPENNNEIISSRLGNNNWYKYDETICGNPWRFNWLKEPTNEDLAGAVKGYLIGLGVNVIDIRVSRIYRITSGCTDCNNCLNGIQYFVRVLSPNDIRILVGLGFYKAVKVPLPQDNPVQII